MKTKTTRKAIVDSTPAKKLVAVGYCGAQTLLKYQSPIAYTSGVYGWNFDVYKIGDVVICTGYRGMSGRHDLPVAEYETRARQASEAYCNGVISYADCKTAIDHLLQEFCDLAK